MLLVHPNSHTAMSVDPIVVVESPYSGDVERNIAYAQRAMADARNRGEIAIVSHLMWTQHHEAPRYFVSDYDPKYTLVNCGRERSLRQTEQLRKMASKVVFYIDYGFSSGMDAALQHCKEAHIAHEFRQLGQCERDERTAHSRVETR